MSRLHKTILSSDIKQYIIRSKNIHFIEDACVIQAGFGEVEFDFSNTLATSCVFIFKKSKGISFFNVNGMPLLSSNGLRVDLPENRKLVCSVDSHHKDIFISGIDLFTNQNISWNTLLKMCDSYSGLRLVGTDLFASIGSKIISSKISEIKTNPENMYVINGNVVNFLGSCKVTTLQFTHIEECIKNTPVVNEAINVLMKKSEELASVLDSNMDNVIFDTSIHGFNNAFCGRDTDIDGSSILMDYVGSYRVPLKMLHPGQYYTVALDVERLNGNAKFLFSIQPDNNMPHVCIAAGGRKTFKQQFLTDASGEYFLNIARHPSSTGKIRITKIIIIANFKLDFNVAIPTISEIYTPKINYVAPELKQQISIGVQSRFKTSSNEDCDSVKKSSIEFADVVPSYIVSNVLPFKGNVDCSTQGSLSWFSKAKPFLPDVMMNKQSSVLFCNIDNVRQCSTVVLEEFVSLNETAVNALKTCNKILVSSNKNFSQLVDVGISEDRLSYSYRPWPYVEPVELRPLLGSDFVVVPNRDDKATRRLLQCLESSVQKIVVLGARGQYSDSVFTVNEYLYYPNLLWLLRNAKVIYDFHIIDDYKSALLSMALSLGTPIVTNSFAFSNDSQAAIKLGKEQHGNIMLPSIEELQNTLKFLPDKRNINMNNDFQKWIENLFNTN
jgi:hypothetical protein